MAAVGTQVVNAQHASRSLHNPVKPFVDCLQKRYGFNDRRIKRAIIDVVEVKKGEEYIKFDLRELTNEKAAI